ncbi:helix-turn-helix domain-containing protein [Nodularia sp. NIES-3585]|uniref:helix-turn-helix domain-containing protein n=1 Tax=Nodularia sp. NIES-3585 TaxID=1973477 RepID=UPI000B5C73C0|nr:helix-turn-helix domain-containing protein [Nodularia sp. NIES-3585]
MSDYQANTKSTVANSYTGKFLTSFQLKLLQKSLQEDLPNSYRQRIEIMLLADQGKSQTAICKILGCCPATVRHWTHIARTGMAHQWQDCPIGRPKAVNDEYLERLKELVLNSPRDYGYAFRRWTANWLQKHLAKEFGIEVSDRHIKRLLKQMGLSTRPKTKNEPEAGSENTKSSSILIHDLKSDNIPENNGFMPIQFAKLGMESETYGAKSIRSCGFFTTVEPCIRSFPGRSGISALLPTI